MRKVLIAATLLLPLSFSGAQPKPLSKIPADAAVPLDSASIVANAAASAALSSAASQAQDELERKKELARQIKHDDADLAAQNRAATAAERSATYAKWQLWLSLLGTLGLLATLFFTQRTLRLTQRSLAHAEDALAISRDTAGKELRAYLSAALNPIPLATSAGFTLVGMRIDIQLKNSGATPAYRTSLKYGISIVNAGDAAPDLFELTEGTDATFVISGGEVVAGDHIPVRREILAKVGRGESDFYVFVKVLYEDIFGCCHSVIVGSKLEFHFDPDKVEPGVFNWYKNDHNICRLVGIPHFGTSD